MAESLKKESKAFIEITKLINEIRHNDYLYYVLDQPEISDYEYDQLLKQLQNLEKQYPGLISADSPTQRVSGHASATFSPVKHTVSMLSLDNVYCDEELYEWHKRLKKLLKNEKIELVVELKIDGVSLNLTYEKGFLVKAATRGDGETGEDITPNAKTIRNIPLKLYADPVPDFFEVRGEVYINRKDFLDLNKSIAQNNEQLFANPRNAAAGSLRQKNSSITAKRPLKFFIHSYGKVEGQTFLAHLDFLDYCRKIGLKPTENAKKFTNISDIIEYKNYLESIRDTLAYEIDGMVIKVNSLSQQRVLGFTMKSPRWAVAYKFAARQATTKIENIRIQIGRTGIITPVADLYPVELSGVIISHATLHNFDEIKRLDARIGDTVLIERAGDVIPKVVKVIQSKRTGNEIVFNIPLNCPVCSGRITKEKEDEVAYRCINPSCPAQLEQSILHFAKRDTMNIEGLGDSVVEQLVSKKIVFDFADIYYLKKETLLGLNLFADKKAQKLIDAVEKSKNQPLSRLLYALGIRHVGEKAAWILANKFKKIDAVMAADINQLTQIKEIGDVMAQSIVEFFSLSSVKNLIDRIIKAGVNTVEPDSQADSLPLSGLTFVLTGELKSFSRLECEKKIRDLGGNPSSSVSKKTDYVVAGENPGSKYDKAKKLNVKILNEEEFIKLLNEQK